MKPLPNTPDETAPEKVSASPHDARTQFKHVAMLICWMWLFGIGLGLYFKESLPRAVAGMTLMAAAGWIAWFCYRIISRRSDYLPTTIFAMMACRPVGAPAITWADLIIIRLSNAAVLIFAACFVGIFLRVRQKPKPNPPPAPLWDDEIDRLPARSESVA